MASVRLKKLLKNDMASIIHDMSQTFHTPIAIQDAKGKYLLGEASDSYQEKYQYWRCPIQYLHLLRLVYSIWFVLLLLHTCCLCKI